MPWGEHGLPMKKTRMADVPASYLLKLYRQPWVREYPDLFDYLRENQDRILRDSEGSEPEPMGEFTSFEDYMRYGR